MSADASKSSSGVPSTHAIERQPSGMDAGSFQSVRWVSKSWNPAEAETYAERDSVTDSVTSNDSGVYQGRPLDV